MDDNELDLMQEMYLNAPVNNAESEFAVSEQSEDSSEIDSEKVEDAEDEGKKRGRKKKAKADGKTEHAKELYYYAKDKKEIVLETLVIVLFALSALFNAYTNWLDSVYTREEDRLVSKSMDLKNESSTEYINANTVYFADMDSYNDIVNTVMELTINDMVDQYLSDKKIETSKDLNSISGILVEELFEMKVANNSFSQLFIDNFLSYIKINSATYAMSPFANAEFKNLYFAKSDQLSSDSEKALDESEECGSKASKFHFASLLFSALMFLLGINKAFKGFRNCMIVFVVAMILFIPALIYTFTLPIPFKLLF